MTTWADIVAAGGGTIEYRLVIEGCKYEFVTCAEMEGGGLSGGESFGKYRVSGLRRAGLGFSEKAYLAGAELDVTIQAIEIIETSGTYLDAATEVFSAIPNVIGYLSTNADASDTTLYVADETEFNENDIVHIGTEAVAIASSDPGEIAVDRGMWRTTPQAHNMTSGVIARVVPIFDAVSFWKNRRVWLYAHGDTELATTSAGTLIWRGRLGSEPQLQGGEATTWTLNVESRWEFLEQEIAANAVKEYRLRGIYYAGESPFWMSVRRSPGASSGGLTLDDVAEVELAGFFESNEEFCQTLCDELNANALIASWGHVFSPVIQNGKWDLAVTIPSPARFLEIWGGSPVDGYFYTGEMVTPEAYRAYGTGMTTGGTYTVEADVTYIVPWYTMPFSEVPVRPAALLRTVPRHHTSFTPVTGSASEISSYPLARIYLDNVAGLTVGDSIQLARIEAESTDGSAPAADPSLPFDGEIASVNTANGYILIYNGAGQPPRFSGAGTDTPAIAITRRFGGSAGTDLAGFRDALVTAAPVVANDAAGPWVLDDDLADWSAAVSAAARGRPFLTSRNYVFHKAHRLTDVLKHEARLYGLFFYLDADFKIAVRRLTIETASISADLHATGAKLLTDNGFGEIRDAGDGLVNVVEISRGFDSAEDDYTLNPYHIVNVGSVSAAKRRAVLTIEPKVQPVSGEITEAEAVELHQTVTGMFGGRIVHVVIDVPLTFWNVRVGDSILITSEQLPLDGARRANTIGGGLNSRRAIVVAREWMLDEPRGVFTCMVMGLNVAGYAPAAKVASASGAGTNWTVTVTATHYATSGTQDCSYFTAGDEVTLVERDATSPTTRTGTVVTVNTGTNQIELSLDSSWTGVGSATYDLVYSIGTTPIVDAQKAYAFIADQTFRVSYGASSAMARLFAP